MAKEKLSIAEKEFCQDSLKNKILSLIKSKGLRVAELQIEALKLMPKSKLPTRLDYKETLRIYELTIIDYKKSLIKQQEKQFNKQFKKTI